VLASNQSFTVSTAEKDHSCIALFLQKLPVMVQQLAPSTSYYFDPMNVMFYLTVTRAKPGIAVPPPRQNLERIDRILAISMSTPTLVTFSPGTPNVIFDLTPTLMFQPAA
jgi:hypothetical protein